MKNRFEIDGDVTVIWLTTGERMLIDTHDLELISQYTWYRCINGTGKVYARTTRSGKTLFLHRFLLGEVGRQQVDHVNRDSLDNRRTNLRICSPLENQGNVGLSRKNSSGYKGVSWALCGLKRKWKVSIQRKHFGYFDTAEEAARVYDVAAREIFGDFAKTNFEPVRLAA